MEPAPIERTHADAAGWRSPSLPMGSIALPRVAALLFLSLVA